MGGIQLHKLVDHDLHRPAIGDDVMLHQYQHMLLRGQAQQFHSQQRALLQIERPVNFGLHQVFDLECLGLDQGDFHPRVFDNDLQGAVTIGLNVRAQAFVPANQSVEAALQGCYVQLTD